MSKKELPHVNDLPAVRVEASGTKPNTYHVAKPGEEPTCRGSLADMIVANVRNKLEARLLNDVTGMEKRVMEDFLPLAVK